MNKTETYFWTSTSSMMWCYRCCAAFGYGSQVTCWFSTQSHYTIWACTIQRWMRRVQGLYKMNRNIRVLDIWRILDKQTNKQTRKKPCTAQSIWTKMSDRTKERACVSLEKWLFNGNIYIAHLIESNPQCKRNKKKTAHMTDRKAFAIRMVGWLVVFRVWVSLHIYSHLALSHSFSPFSSLHRVQIKLSQSETGNLLYKFLITFLLFKQ